MRVRLFFMLTLLAAWEHNDFSYAADPDEILIVIDDQSHQLEGKTGYEKSFSSVANPTESTLLFEQKLEKQSSGRYWSVKINGTVLGRLEAHLPQIGSKESGESFHLIGIAIPANLLQAGNNTLVITGTGNPAVVRNFKLDRRPLKGALQLGTITVKVLDSENQRPVPARVTIVDALGRLAKLYYARTPTTAVRPGILYTLGTGDSFSLPAGKYTLYATRGMEWGVAKQSIVVKGHKQKTHQLEITREVDTTGFIACDSHIHTLPGSGHGNASYAERMITIAGEGIEVAIATDHNHISSYDQHQQATGTHNHFHSISGDEVTTHNGHFTAFPLDPTKAVPGGVQGKNPLFLESKDWTMLIADMRAKGAEVVLLNHPYWPTIPAGPFGEYGFNRQTGARRTGPEFTFDGIEVAQPANMIPDSFYALDDWLALLNRGLKMTAVGATDSHSVHDPVGQARTYLKSPTNDVTKIINHDVYHAFVDGHASVASGIFATLTIDQHTMGDLVIISDSNTSSRLDGKDINVQLRIATPSWVHPREAMIYLNGQRVAQQAIEAKPDKPTDQTLEFSIDLPVHDAHVVAFVLGDDITLPGWTTYGKATQAITNPIYLDVDHDGKYTSPRETAQNLIASYDGESTKLSPSQQAELLETETVKADPIVLLHVKDLLKQTADKN